MEFWKVVRGHSPKMCRLADVPFPIGAYRGLRLLRASTPSNSKGGAMREVILGLFALLLVFLIVATAWALRNGWS